jgi:hypothetical protein
VTRYQTPSYALTRHHGIIVDDVPAHLSPKDSPSTHSIYIPDDDISIPLKICGIISHLESCTPTKQEIDTYKWVIISNEHNLDPHANTFQEAEENYFQLQNHLGNKNRPIIFTPYLNLMNSYIVLIWTKSQVPLTIVSYAHIKYHHYCQPLLVSGSLPLPQKISLNVGA